VRHLGWTGLSNGVLLQRMAAAGIGVLITADRNFEYQQNPTRFSVGLVVLVAPSNSPDDLVPLGHQIADAITGVEPGGGIHVRV